MKQLRNAFLTALVAGGFILIILLLPERGRRERSPPFNISRSRTAPQTATARSSPTTVRSSPSNCSGIRHTDQCIRRQVTPPSNLPGRDGIALAILLDASSSMRNSARNPAGALQPKVYIARDIVTRILGRVRRFTEKYPWLEVQVGIYKFSGNRPQALLPLGRFQHGRAIAVLDGISTSQWTPIGNAMLRAKRDLDRSGLKGKQMILVTDGENSRGTEPDRVARAIGRLPPDLRADIHFITVDMKSDDRAEIQKTSRSIIDAGNTGELDRLVDRILQEQIPREIQVEKREKVEQKKQQEKPETAPPAGPSAEEPPKLERVYFHGETGSGEQERPSPPSSRSLFREIRYL